METWNPMGGPEKVIMTKAELDSMINQAKEEGYQSALKRNSHDINKIANELAISLSKAILLINE